MRTALLAFALVATATSASAAGRVPYGTREGMEVTVTAVEGIGTDRAVIHVRHTRENAREFCVGYSDDKSDACVDKVMRETRINDELRGNCRSGVFIALSGEKFRFAGRSNTRDRFAAKYILLGREGFLEGNNASGYFTYLAQFAALCPGKVELEE